MTYRAFCRVSTLTATPSKSALAATLRRVSPRTLATLNDAARDQCRRRARVEPARTVRMDATVVPVAIHPPTDSTLLLDAVRVLDRLLRRRRSRPGFTAYHRHLKRAKRRAMEILHLAPRATRGDAPVIASCSSSPRPRRATPPVRSPIWSVCLRRRRAIGCGRSSPRFCRASRK